MTPWQIVKFISMILLLAIVCVLFALRNIDCAPKNCSESKNDLQIVGENSLPENVKESFNNYAKKGLKYDGILQPYLQLPKNANSNKSTYQIKETNSLVDTLRDWAKNQSIVERGLFLTIIKKSAEANAQMLCFGKMQPKMSFATAGISFNITSVINNNVGDFKIAVVSEKSVSEASIQSRNLDSNVELLTYGNIESAKYYIFIINFDSKIDHN